MMLTAPSPSSTRIFSAAACAADTMRCPVLVSPISTMEMTRPPENRVVMASPQRHRERRRSAAADYSVERWALLPRPGFAVRRSACDDAVAERSREREGVRDRYGRRRRARRRRLLTEREVPGRARDLPAIGERYRPGRWTAAGRRLRDHGGLGLRPG